ncbi:MAG: hypothetical protein ACRDSS_07945 [Actinocrinis sp.]
MSDLPEPTSVERPAPKAIWHVPGSEDFWVRRNGDEVIVSNSIGRLFGAATETAARVGAAMSAAAVWTDEPIVTCGSECTPDYCAPVAADERHTNGDVLHGVVLRACPPWMSGMAARELADRILADMARNVTHRD